MLNIFVIMNIMTTDKKLRYCDCNHVGVWFDSDEHITCPICSMSNMNKEMEMQIAKWEHYDEIVDDLRALYRDNFGIYPAGDIRHVKAADIPKHDILCAGFPCQPFSKAGEQKGLECPKWGDLFGHVMRIVKAHSPTYVILENVPNLEKHDHGKTWASMQRKLKRAGYAVKFKTLSPHKFGIPQVRTRVFIVASLKPLADFSWPTETVTDKLNITSVLTKEPVEARPLSKQVIDCLTVWQEFIDKFPKDEDFPTFPIWAMEFAATYPFAEKTPYSMSTAALKNYRGNFGESLAGYSEKTIMAGLPPYARDSQEKFPDWKIEFIRWNRELYTRHEHWMKQWIPKIMVFPPSLQKLEWNCKGEPRNIWDYVIQFRASGVRVKRTTTAPALVAMTTTQVPIIAWEKRYMTPRECAKLQSLSELKKLPAASTKAYKALGNSINANVVELVARSLLEGNSKKPACVIMGKIVTVLSKDSLKKSCLTAN